jgi:hypothetical protein
MNNINNGYSKAIIWVGCRTSPLKSNIFSLSLSLPPSELQALSVDIGSKQTPWLF